MKQALLVIDVQNDYFENGKMVLENPDKALPQINKLEEFFQKTNQPIIYVQHINEQPDAAFFSKNTQGVELHPSLHLTEQSVIVKKQFPNSFLQTNLESVLKSLAVEQLVIVGMMTHMCIDSTTRASAELGYQPIVIADATATRSLQFEETTISANEVQYSFLAALQTFAQLKSTDEFL
ncbi:isochorismatase [Enterococcus sp. JM4C]|uniref:cysteine hydrolase family protein n=1 Tax=Candidatus Enterococcus huntleyi TaxID=1857217 RepID=UPI001379E1F3|nr:cysteine hydrolase family protein [Enterococcus sp. JM4C]KAF1296728.1 isochorismatase [Enterococcus sp. JM4C]